ncbi:MAG: MTH938/NDUFAF3 family protein [Thermodesulfovibrionales bacterium]|nr:hypothetical protein [Nitrospinota bacterium]MCG2709756.1 MTH938/NDUFAF3 family protein [Thermodesulfovibrionales bacterium]MCG2813755.1 MTH938/NDUFAF3 family protein [Thermodesulfovibrionales bacterium]
MHIDDYSFGRIVIDKITYTSDVIIYPDRVDSSWWRKEGHYLQPVDLEDIINAKPDILIIGTGNSGVMQVPKETLQFIKTRGIEVYVGMTDSAVELFSKMQSEKSDKRIIAAL